MDATNSRNILKFFRRHGTIRMMDAEVLPGETTTLAFESRMLHNESMLISEYLSKEMRRMFYWSSKFKFSFLL
jgi:hypothetical protein